jgi:hypothetical protein
VRTVIVRYKVKPERLAEHESLIRGVFDELARSAPPGIRYGAFKEADGLSFVHFATITAEKNPLDAIAAFKAFTANVRERCESPPVTTELAEVCAYALV